MAKKMKKIKSGSEMAEKVVATATKKATAVKKKVKAKKGY